MQECRLIVAANIIYLRNRAGLTQAELGEKLRYSDKSVSKWECGAAVPDVLVLKNMADLFGVSVDYFLEEHPADPAPEGMPLVNAAPLYRSIAGVTLAGLWALAILICVIFWLLDARVPWAETASLALVISCILLLVFNSVWREGRQNLYLVMALVLSILLALFAFFWPHKHLWQLLTVVAPFELVVYLAFRVYRAGHPGR